MIKKNILLQAMLTSTLLMNISAQAGPCVGTPTTCISTLIITGVTYDTSVKGTIGISDSGQLDSSALYAISIDSPSSSVTLDPNNVQTFNAGILADNNGIEVVDTLATITIGANTQARAQLHVIDILGTQATLNNAGIIFSNSNGVTILAGGTGATITNTGFIATSGLSNSIEINDNFTSINNQGTIGNSIFSNGIVLASTTATGSITNSAIINGRQGIIINSPYTDTITNNLGGTISGATTHGITINNAAASPTINNAGTIQASSTSFAINLVNSVSGSINNTGLIQSGTQAIFLGGDFTALNNNGGTISSSSASDAVILAGANTTFSTGIVNSGNITNNTAGGNAIKLSAANVDIPLFQNGGTITGNVLLDTVGGNVLTMTGGTIAGNVSAFGTASDILTLSGGSITGTTTLGGNDDTLQLSGATLQGVVGGAGDDTYNISSGSLTTLTDNGGKNTLNFSGGTFSGAITFAPSTGSNILNLNSGTITPTITLGNNGDTVNFSGANIQIINGGTGIDIFNATGGSFATLNGGAGDILNINASFTSGAINNVPTINVNNAGTIFTVGAPITGLSNQILINNDTTTLVNASITGTGNITLQNNATLQVNSSGNVNVNGGVIVNGTLATISNAGTIQTSTSPTIVLNPGASITQINNSGTLIANSPQAVIVANGNNTSTIGIVNSGNITNLSGDAIDLSGAANINIPLIQNGGIITGNVLLDTQGGIVLTMNGGTINGDVSAFGLINPDILNLNGGTVTGTITLGTLGDTVNLAGSSIQTLNGGAGADIFNVTGGSFTSLNGGVGDILNINANFTSSGTINNVPTINVNNAGTIFTVGAPITGLSNQMLINNNTSTIVNSNITGIGNITLQNNALLKVNSGGSVNVDGGVIVNGTLASIINAGTIQTSTSPTILLNSGASITQINNSGTLIANSPQAVIVASGNNTSTIGIVNSGNITNLSGNAIDLSGAANINIPLIQNGGIITGNVLLETDGGIVLTMNGGTINGDVKAFGISNPDILNLNGGIITGTTTLGTLGDTVNLVGSSIGILNGGAGADTFNVTGGSFASLNGGVGDILNVNASFTSTGTINNVPTINVNNAGTIFTVNQPISGMNLSLTTNPQTSIIFNTNIPSLGSGAIQNNGTLQVNNNFTVTGTGPITNTGTVSIMQNSILQAASYNQTPGSKFIVNLQNASTSQLQVTTTATLQSGSTVNPIFDSNSFLQSGIFDVIVAAPGGVTDNSTLAPSSASNLFLTFSKSGPSGESCNSGANTCVQITVNRSTIIPFALSIYSQGVANTLDSLMQQYPNIDPELLNTIMQLELLKTPQEVTNALESLVPPFNYGLVAGSRANMDLIMNGIEDRLFDLQAKRKHRFMGPGGSKPAEQGMSFGDISDNIGAGPWIRINGAELEQNSHDGALGFTANAASLALGADWNVNNCMVLGIAGSYAKVHVKDKNINAKDQGIQSWQSFAYGSLDFVNGIFLDAIVGQGLNDYHTNRMINVNLIHTAAIADFNGNQYGAEVDIGVNFESDYHYDFAPFVRFKYMHLDLDDYTESGAGSLNLFVTNHHLSQRIAGIGFSLSTSADYINIHWEPDLSAFVGYDFNHDNEQTVAGFLGGGPAFATPGVNPGGALFNLSAGLNASMGLHSTLSLKYHLEWRDEFISNAGYVQYAYLWS